MAETAESADAATTARAILDANAYLVLATADAAGTPWATPVWFAPLSATELAWVSRPDARHSRNVAARPEVGIAVFDSTAAIGTGEGVYAEATAALVPDAELERAVEAYSRHAQAQGGRAWAVADVTGDSQFRLYAARVRTAYVLDGHDRRVAVRLDARS